MTEKKSEGYDVIKGLCRQITDVAEKREKQYQAELQAVREENQHLLLMVERLTKEAMDPFRSCVTYDFVVSYIANRSEKNAEPLISMFEALLPQDMQQQFREDILNKREENRAGRKHAKKDIQPRISARNISSLTIVDGNNIEHVNHLMQH